MMPPRYFKDCLNFVLAAILFLGMFGFINTSMYVKRYFKYHYEIIK